jgi:hypothetical protein
VHFRWQSTERTACRSPSSGFSSAPASLNRRAAQRLIDPDVELIDVEVSPFRTADFVEPP